MTLNIAVCDDEKPVCEYLKNRISELLSRWDADGKITVFKIDEELNVLIFPVFES